MIQEGMNININDIEDDDLRKKVIKYFKTFKKGKLEDEDLDELDDNDSDDSDDNNESTEFEEDNVDLKNISDDEFKDLIKSFDDKTKEELINDLKSNLEDLDGDEKEGTKKLIKIINDENVSESLVVEALSILGTVIATTVITSIANAIKRNNVRKTSQKLKELADQEKDKDKKKELEEKLDTYNSVAYKDGKPITDKKILKKRLLSLKNQGKLDKNFKTIDLYNIRKETNSSYKDIDKQNGDTKEKKDSEGNILKKEEITDKDGKKKTVTTHTGPRGGKFYWPDGSPKDAKHKVYIGKNGKVKECMDLTDYLYESFSK